MRRSSASAPGPRLGLLDKRQGPNNDQQTPLRPVLLSWDVSWGMGEQGGCQNCVLWSDRLRVSILPQVLGAHPTLFPVTAATFNPLPSVGSRIK